MSANVHPTSSDLLAAVQEPGQATTTLEHVDECLACRVRLSRIRQIAGSVTSSDDSVQRIVQASAPLPAVLADIVSDSHDSTPQPNEVWRVGDDEALLVWVRQVFDDGVADVIPLVLDVELADQESVVVEADATPLGTEVAAMAAVRTHIHPDAFLNRVGSLDIRKAVAEVMIAVREGRRPSGVRVGPPIGDDDDQRLEYRQALRDLLAELSPSAWAETHEEPNTEIEPSTYKHSTDRSADAMNITESHLGQRLPGLQFHNVDRHTVRVDDTLAVSSYRKIVYLDAPVLVAMLEGEHIAELPDVERVAEACRTLTSSEQDVDAVALAIPYGDCPTLLVTTAHLRDAVELPSGIRRGPTVTLVGHGLVDTLWKYLEGAAIPWEVTEQVTDRIGTKDLHQKVVKHATDSIRQINVSGRRALQPAKRSAWENFPDNFSEQVARFVMAIVDEAPANEALVELGLETPND